MITILIGQRQTQTPSLLQRFKEYNLIQQQLNQLLEKTKENKFFNKKILFLNNISRKRLFKRRFY